MMKSLLAPNKEFIKAVKLLNDNEKILQNLNSSLGYIKGEVEFIVDAINGEEYTTKPIADSIFEKTLEIIKPVPNNSVENTALYLESKVLEAMTILKATNIIMDVYYSSGIYKLKLTQGTQVLLDRPLYPI